MQESRLTVDTAEGPVAGVAQEETEAWYGVPYAAPPVGECRFLRPRPAPWHGEPLVAGEWGPSPMQAPVPEAMGGVGDSPDIDEDCLTLNIVRPAGTAGEGAASGLPVMVWIYGGAFTVGASRNYDGRQLAARGDVIVVTVNYRVGPWGFLDLSSLSGDGGVFESNNGLHDQIAALTWVRDNIAAFGGDPGNVTVFGESAGGSSVLSLMCMPGASGLFHRVVAESPAVAGSPQATHDRWARRFARFVAAEVGAGSADSDLAGALLGASPEQLMAAVGQLAQAGAAEEPGVLVYGPCVDGTSLPEAPLHAFTAGRQARVPLVIGTNRHEGKLFLAAAQMTGTEILPVLPDTVRGQLGERPAAADLLAAYPGFPDPEESAQLGGDMVFWYPATVVADAHAAVAPTFVYRFDFVSQDERFGMFGATHGQEIPYLFGRVRAALLGEGAGPGDRDVAFSEGVMDRWLGFARDGIPDAAWPAYGSTERPVLVLDSPGAVENDPQGGRREAWSRYFAG
jgi:para-nitrobenzyl esterase